MWRRWFILAFLPWISDPPESPRNYVAEQGNLFNSLLVRWANAFNKMKPDTLDTTELAAWSELTTQFRKFERAHDHWIRGN